MYYFKKKFWSWRQAETPSLSFLVPEAMPLTREIEVVFTRPPPAPRHQDFSGVSCWRFSRVFLLVLCEFQRVPLSSVEKQ